MKIRQFVMFILVVGFALALTRTGTAQGPDATLSAGVTPTIESLTPPVETPMPLIESQAAQTQPNQVVSTAGETLIVPFSRGTTGVQTSQSYNGLVTVMVSGVGQASGTSYSDAFYIYTNYSGQPITPVHPTVFYNWSLWINGGPVDNFVQPIPPYNPNHTYNFTITAPGGPLTFAIGDAISSDNTGAYTITINPPPPSDKLPIVFVHGWAGWPPFPLLGPCDWPDPDSYFESVDEYLEAAGYHVEYAHLETSRCYTPSLTENVWRLQNAIALAKSATHQPKVILIAHSMGGLVSRAYIENDSIYQNDVEALFTFGSPHLGVPSDLVTIFLNGATLGIFCKDRQPAVCDFSEAGMRLFNRNHTPRSHEVDYHLISGDTPFFSRNILGWLTDPLIPGPDDGITPTNSGLGGNHPSFFLDRFQTDENHNLFGPRSYFIRDGGPSRSYTECLQPVLVSHSGRENCGGVSAQQITTQDTSTLTERTTFEYGTLQPGQIATHNLSLEGGATLFATQWQTGTLTVTLVDPNSQTIDPIYATNHSNIVTYNADANIATYYFPNAIAGQWQLKLQANSDVPIGGSAYTTFAAFDSAISLTGQTDRDWYTPGATATIAASLSGSPTSATVTATVLDANGAAQSIGLSPVGGGNYQGAYTVPNVPGYAEVRLVVTGVTASGVSFERGKNLMFQISPNSISLSGTYSDAPQPHASNPALYEALNVTVSVNAAVSGRFGLSADLMDTSGNFVAHSLIIENINPGSSTLTLRFEGDDIYASGRNGPYTLTNLLLTDQRSTTLAVAEATNVYTTAAYDYRNFGTTSIYLPIIVK